MRAVVVYESMYGNTHVVADHVCSGLQSAYDVVVTSADGADDEMLVTADLLVVGGPTHIHGMSSTMSRKSAVEAAEKDADLQLDADAEGPGLRDWFSGLNKHRRGPAAAFDTRLDGAAVLTGRASKGIAHRLRKHGFELIADSESFLVDKENHLLSGEADRAREWGLALARSAVPTDTPR